MKRESQQISRISQIFFIRVIRIIRSCFLTTNFTNFTNLYLRVLRVIRWPKQKARRNPKTVPGESQCFTQYLLLSGFYFLLSEEDSVAVCSVNSAVGWATSLVGDASLTASSSPSLRFWGAILLSLCASIPLTLFLMQGENPNRLRALESRSGHRL